MLCAQARRLESQLYQRAQDLRTIEVTQRQAALAERAANPEPLLSMQDLSATFQPTRYCY